MRSTLFALGAPGIMLVAGLAGPVRAQSQIEPSAPAAALQIFSGGPATSKWYGTGLVALRKDLCLASTSGTYQLSVSGFGGMKDSQGRPIGQKLRLRDGAGATHEAVAATGGTAVFVGSDPQRRADCTQGVNATIEIEIGETDLAGAVAGTYVDNLVLSIEPR